MRLFLPTQSKVPENSCKFGQRNHTSGVLFIGFLVCCSASEPVHAEASGESRGDSCDSSTTGYSRVKKVYTDYSVIGIPGEGRCLFRSVAHGACVRSGNRAPDENLQRQLADELWARMPISVYMYDQDASGLISIAEYGQEYGKDNPIKVLYHGFGHYDALHIPGKKGPRSKL
ncbi:OVARIAN TUMOR DOMAIN-containing deubiquitinating enzyme 4-like [Solanum dulcamara]|uniref:OVARIAN TUMOR DOMAIN-containing deubiquitinating enzyme 4-like n=1 Tax=Solanum dulcamara TaxID=45834 RepID=UPI002486A861|nr:OVARIAN TUMOR DOMAIN-containing deubiquitinating enzyme 4-like [Solanum dulcamara]